MAAQYVTAFVQDIWLPLTYFALSLYFDNQNVDVVDEEPFFFFFWWLSLVLLRAHCVVMGLRG